MRVACTADLHWGTHADGDAATRLLAASLHADPPDVLVLAGDVGAGDHFDACLALFDGLPGRKALVPGNHDVWVRADDPRGDSLQVYRDHLPRLCAAHGFHYLDHGPLYLPEADLALAGSMNWYDYSWGRPGQAQFPQWEARVRGKRFSRGRHNDANFIRWPFDDAGFTAAVVAALERHLDEARRRARDTIVVTHHPPCYDLSFPRPPLGVPAEELRPGTPEYDRALDRSVWDALGGNTAVEELLRRHADHVRFVFCGHTHLARESRLGDIRGYNIGGDYHHKRLLLLDWPAGTVAERVFTPQEAT
jgi:3',5'-cyclic AMP phosphodiesterase CpdA